MRWFLRVPGECNFVAEIIHAMQNDMHSLWPLYLSVEGQINLARGDDGDDGDGRQRRRRTDAPCTG